MSSIPFATHNVDPQVEISVNVKDRPRDYIVLNLIVSRLLFARGSESKP